MDNATQLGGNMTAYISRASDIVSITFFSLILLLFCIFSYFMAVILNAFFTIPHVRENPRYILFIHMLINDLLYLAVSFFLFTCAVCRATLPLSLCYVIVTFATCTFRITPSNLAVMSLERYAAICHPLRHAELCTAQKCNAAIAFMWTVVLIPQVVDFIAFCSSVEKRVFSFTINCHWPFLIVNEVQVVLRTLTTLINFTAVGLIITYTYIKVMLVALTINTGKSDFKAGKTVLLHAFQFMLCMLSFTSSYTEVYLAPYALYLPLMNFFLFTCLPRFISPLVYGIRDEVLGKHMRKICSL